jgi:hypothetical protein
VHAQPHPQRGGAELGGRLPDGSPFELDQLERVSLRRPQLRERGADDADQALGVEEIVRALDGGDELGGHGLVVDFDQKLSSLLTPPVGGVGDQPAQDRPRPGEDLGPAGERMNRAHHVGEGLVDQVFDQRFVLAVPPRKRGEAVADQVVNDAQRLVVALRVTGHRHVGRARIRVHRW